MINVKGFRETDQAPQGLPEEYAEKKVGDDAKPSRSPILFFVVLVGFVAYLKSFLTSPAEALPAAEEPRQTDEDEQAVPAENARAAKAAEDEETGAEKQTDDHDEEDDEEVADNILLFTSSFIPDFLANGAPTIEFSSAGRIAPSSALRPFGSGQPLNDNALNPSLTAFSGFGTGFGGGGNSGGGIDTGGGSTGGGGIDTGGGGTGGGNTGGGNTGGGGSTGGGSTGGGSTGGGSTGGDNDGGTGEPANRAPRLNGTVRLHDMVGFHAYFIAYGALLAGANDPDGDPLAVLDLTATRGTLSRVEGGWLYEGEQDVLGEVAFSYGISDGTTAVQQTAYLNVLPAAPIAGGQGDDALVGTPDDDDISGGAGDDNIVALDGDDLISGGSGDDHIVGGAGDDTIHAGCGDDIVFAGAGNDIVFGGCGNDRLFGESGNDILYGEQGDDLLVGDSGNDKMFGGAGQDQLDGGAGDDVLEGGADSDLVSGGDGDDHVIGDRDAAPDQYSGGAGNDIIDYSLTQAGLVIDLNHGSAESAEVGFDRLHDFEKVVAGAGSDTVFATHNDEVVIAGSGNDIVFGGCGDDRIYGQSGDDVLFGEHGDDLLSGGEGFDTLTGGYGDDELQGDAGDDVLRGDEGDDTLVAGDGNDALLGGSGHDRLNGGDGNDFLDGEAGSDVVAGGHGNDHVRAATDAVSDHYSGGGGEDTIDYSSAVIGLTVDLEAGIVESSEVGFDTIDGFESFIAGSGDDNIHLGEHYVEIRGGGGQNSYTFDLPNGRRGSDDVVARITDFKVGDQLFVADFEIKYRDEQEFFEELEDAFDKIYMSENLDHRTVKFRFDKMDEKDITVVEVQDINGDGIDDSYAIVMDGRHAIGVTVAVVSG